MAQLLLIRKFYCVRPDPNISLKYARHNHLRCPIMGELSFETVESMAESLSIYQKCLN